MGLIVRDLTRKKIFAVFVGVFIAGTLVLAFDLWLSGLIDRQGQEEVDTSAKRAIALADPRVKQVVSALDKLAGQGAASCSPDHIQAMRQTAFDTYPVQEIAVVAPDGQTLCTHLSLPLGQRKVLASEPLPGVEGYTFDIIRLGTGEHMVRLRRKGGDDLNEFAALVPAILFLPQVSTQGGPPASTPLAAPRSV